MAQVFMRPEGPSFRGEKRLSAEPACSHSATAFLQCKKRPSRFRFRQNSVLNQNYTQQQLSPNQHGHSYLWMCYLLQWCLLLHQRLLRLIKQEIRSK